MLFPALLVLLSLAAADDARDLRRHVETLASEQFEGRETGEPGCRAAEDYVADAFTEAGLQPVSGSDFYLPFEVARVGFDPDRSKLSLDGDEAGAGTRFRPFPFSAAGEANAPVVFAGYGIHAPGLGHDDYAGLDVDGKIVLVFRYEPGRDDPDSPFDGESHSIHAHFATKARVAAARGAVGLLVVTGPLHADATDRFAFDARTELRDLSDAVEPPDDSILSAQVERRWLRRVLRDRDVNLSDLHDDLESGVPARELSLGDLRGALDFRLAERGEGIPTRNVAGLLPGTDPALRDEWIVVGAHHDHVGTTRGGRVYNGADDNASGVAALLEIVDEFAARPRRRSVLFVTFSGEEIGLLGSRALLARRQVPVERLRFMINLDMVGRNPDQPVQILGDGFASGLRERLLRISAAHDLELDFHGQNMSNNSDHAPFFEADIPVAAFFTGFHDDYHQPSDDVEKIAFGRLRRIQGLAGALVAELADTAPEDFPRLQRPLAWLGAMARYESPGWRIAALDELGVRGPLRVGDALLSLDDVPIEHAALFDPSVGKHVLAVERGTAVLRLEVTRSEPGFLGIQPGSLGRAKRRALNLSSGQGLSIDRVIEGSPAARAGLREGDVLLRVDGREVGHRDVRHRLGSLGEGTEITLSLDREGAPLEVVVRLGRR